MRLLRRFVAFYVAKTCFVSWGALRSQSYKKALFAELNRTREKNMAQQKKYIITYQIPSSTAIGRTSGINANSVMEAKNKFKMGNPGKKIIACVKVSG